MRRANYSHSGKVFSHAESHVPKPENGDCILLPDAVFSATFKVHSTVSGRRFMSDLREAPGRGFISRLPHYNSIFNYFENRELTPILRTLITESSLPLKVRGSELCRGFQRLRHIAVSSLV